MKASTKSRNRAVRLTPEALKALECALDARWRESSRHPRLTWEARADLMGVSVATARKVLDNKGVDRAMLVLAFKNLGLSWSESFCTRTFASEPEPAEVQTSVVERPNAKGPSPAASKPFGATGRLPWRTGPVVALPVFVVASLAMWRLATPPSAKRPEWIGVLDAVWADAEARYHRADYVGADRRLREFFRISREHDSSRDLSGALKLSGDIKVVWGRWREAKRMYESALVARESFREPQWAPLLESIGVVEMELREFDAAKAHFDACLAAYRTSRETAGIAQAFRSLGTLALRKGELDRADALFRQSLAILAKRPEPGTFADVRGLQGLLLLARNRPAEARAALEEGLAHWKKERHPRWIAVCEMYLARVDERQGRTADARARLARSKTTFERLGEVARVAETATQLARLARRSD